MTEQKLIDTINALIDADLQVKCPTLSPKDIALRAIEEALARELELETQRREAV